MKYDVIERISAEERTAWSKARNDAERIAQQEGFQPIEVFGTGTDRAGTSLLHKVNEHRKMGRQWKRDLSVLQKGDTLFIQLPVVNNYFFMQSIMKNLRRRGVEIIALVHDLETLRMVRDAAVSKRQKIRMRIEEICVLRQCSRLIVHNDKMRDFLMQLGIQVPMTSLGIFDYLVSPSPNGETIEDLMEKRAAERCDSVIVAGNLDPQKAGYVYHIPETIPADLFGVHYQKTDQKNLRYHGSFPADTLPYELSGGFGLIWDGPQPDTCAGPYGESLRFNNPHKTSLYLAAGFPVIIWKQAALAEFVQEKGVGLVVESLDEIPQLIHRLEDQDYHKIHQNIQEVSKQIRGGAYLRAALRG